MRTRLAMLLALALVAAGACIRSGSSIYEAGPVTIVLEGPLTGDQASTGIDMYNAAKLAVDEANAQGGVLDREIRLVKGDDRADADAGVALANQYSKEAFAVIGPYNSSVGVENLPVWIEGGAIPIHLTSNQDTDGMGYTVQPKDYQVAPIEARAITKFFKAHTVAIVYDKSTYTSGIAGNVKSQLEHSGLDVVFYTGFPEGKLSPADAKAMYDDMAKSGADLFYASTYFPQGGLLAKAGGGHMVATCFMGLANQDAGFVKVAGAAAAENCVFSGVPSADQFPGAQQYVADYEQKFGQAPGTWGTFTYDSVNLLFHAVEEAGSWDPEKVKEALSGTKNYAGITGDISIISATGNRSVVPVVLLNVDEEGAFTVDRKWAAFAGFEV